MKKFRELKEEVSAPPIGVRSLYTKMYAKHGGTISKVKDAQSKAYAEVEKKHGKDMRNSLEAYHKKNMNEEKDEREYDYEGEMVKSDLRSIMANAERITDLLEDDDNLPEWCQNKVTLAEDYISTVANYLTAEMNEETAVSKEKVTDFHKKLDTLVHKTFGKRKEEMKEEVEQLDEKNKPTNPELWSRAVSMAKQKFDVYPSAYANGWAAKWYKEKGGGWRSVNEENYEVTVMHTTKDGAKGEHTHKITNADDARHAKNIALQKHEKMLKSKGQEVRGMGTTNAKMIEAKENDLPFTPDAPKKKSVVVGKKPKGYSIARQLARQAMQKQIDKSKKPMKEAEEKDLPFKSQTKTKQEVIPGKYGAGYSMARHLARQAMQKQIEKMKKPVKEAEERGTEPFLKTSRKAEIVKSAAKNSTKFQSEPELSSTVTRNN